VGTVKKKKGKKGGRLASPESVPGVKTATLGKPGPGPTRANKIWRKRYVTAGQNSPGQEVRSPGPNLTGGAVHPKKGEKSERPAALGAKSPSKGRGCRTKTPTFVIERGDRGKPGGKGNLNVLKKRGKGGRWEFSHSEANALTELRSRQIVSGRK